MFVCLTTARKRFVKMAPVPGSMHYWFDCLISWLYLGFCLLLFTELQRVYQTLSVVEKV